MWNHYLLSLYRALTRHRLYAGLNVLGLAVGIGVFLVLSLYVRFETSFERWLPDAQKIYVVQSKWNLAGLSLEPESSTMGALLDQLKGDYPQLVATRVWEMNATVRQGAEVTNEKLEIVDPTFFKVFNLPLAAGDPARLLQSPDELLLSETRAKHYFGAADPVGRRITIAFLGDVHDYRVAGVVKDPPKNTDLSFDFIVPYTPQMSAQDTHWTHWGSSELSTYLRFDTPAEAAALNADLDRFTDRHGFKDMGKNAHEMLTLRAEPVLSLHLQSPKDAAAVATLGAVGALTLLLAGVNYVNLATARAGLRAKEVALRKVMGATAPALIGQFMLEAVATAALSALIGQALCELALPAVNAAGGLSLRIKYLGPDGVLPLLAAVILVVGLSAGVYPALVLSRFQPASVLASAKTPGGGRASGRVRQALVVVQFAIAIAFTIGTAVIAAQAQYLRHADIGFNRNGLIIVNSFYDSEMTATQRATLLDIWRGLPGVTGATMSDIGPGNDDNTSSGNFTRAGTVGDGPDLVRERIGPQFADVYRLHLLAGRMLDTAHGADDSSPLPPPAATPPTPGAAAAPSPPVDTNKTAKAANVVLSLNAVRNLGFASPAAAIGQTIYSGKHGPSSAALTIVGVIDNVRFRSPRDKVPATIYYFRAKDFDNAIAGVRYATADPKAVMAAMKAGWRQIAPTVPFRALTIEDALQTYYQSDDQRGRLFSIGAGLAVAIGCLGLYGLASFNTARRTKEIGIRKTLGASTADILRLLLGQFLQPVLIANLVAWPLAYLTMQNWLSGFDQRISLNPLYFIGATLLTLAIAVATVAGQAFTVARSEPAKALRYD